MSPILFVLVPILMLAAWLPGWWVRRTLRRYSDPVDRYYGSGAMLARMLLDKHGLTQVSVEESETGDHYDPEARAVRLSAHTYHQRSLTAVTVAAHEVGHALQHAEGYAPLALRERLVRFAIKGQRLGAMMMVAVPVITVLTRHPAGRLRVGHHPQRRGVKYTQPDPEVLHKLRPEYASSADSLTAVSQVIAINFQTVAAANNYWRK